MKLAGIHWATPTLLVASFLAGTITAIGHHLFYASLDRKDASASLVNYKLLGMNVSDQQVNIAAGTTFAFIVRAFLMVAISTAYFQILMWHLNKTRASGTPLKHLDALGGALHDLGSLLSGGAWWRCPWLWGLALVAWLIPIASVVPPATLSVGFALSLPKLLTVPNIQFESLNLLAPMPQPSTGGIGDTPGLYYNYAGPSLAVQQIVNAVASTGSILPVLPPSPNATWNLQFYGPMLQCAPAATQVRNDILGNIWNYTFARPGYKQGDCAWGPGYVAWHPDPQYDDLLPFAISRANTSSSALINYDDTLGYPYADTSSVFIAITPAMFSTSTSGLPAVCNSTDSDYYTTATVLKCEMYNSTYRTNFTFADGIQRVDVMNVTKIADDPIRPEMNVLGFFGSGGRDDLSLQPQPCPPADPEDDVSYLSRSGCLYDPLVLSTLSYQALFGALKNLMTGVISKGDDQSTAAGVTATTQVGGTVLANTPELGFLQSPSSGHAPAQQRATGWTQQPFSGLVNTASKTNSGLSFQQALEQLFQNITISLMSAPELQPNASSAYYPPQTEVQLNIRENVYMYAASKLWLAYGLAIAFTGLIVLLGIAAIIANEASYSNQWSTMLRLSRGAQLSNDISASDLAGQDPLPAYASKTIVRFSRGQAGEKGESQTYMLIDRAGKDEAGVLVQEGARDVESRR